MCSIAGFFNPNIIPDQEKSRRILTAMNKCQCHRGPDEEDIIQAGGCGMAHTDCPSEISPGDTSQ